MDEVDFSAILESGMKLASFKDPNGVLIELVEHPIKNAYYALTNFLMSKSGM